MIMTLDIDPMLLDEALRASDETTRSATVTRALEEFIARRRSSRLQGLFGTLDWDPEFHYKAARGR